MNILVIADEEAPSLWDYFRPEKLKDVDLIILRRFKSEISFLSGNLL